ACTTYQRLLIVVTSVQQPADTRGQNEVDHRQDQTDNDHDHQNDAGALDRLLTRRPDHLAQLEARSDMNSRVCRPLAVKANTSAATSTPTIGTSERSGVGQLVSM